MQSDEEMYHALFSRVGYVGESGHDRRLPDPQVTLQGPVVVCCSVALLGLRETKRPLI